MIDIEVNPQGSETLRTLQSNPAVANVFAFEVAPHKKESHIEVIVGAKPLHWLGMIAPDINELEQRLINEREVHDLKPARLLHSPDKMKSSLVIGSFSFQEETLYGLKPFQVRVYPSRHLAEIVAEYKKAFELEARNEISERVYYDSDLVKDLDHMFTLTSRVTLEDVNLAQEGSFRRILDQAREIKMPLDSERRVYWNPPARHNIFAAPKLRYY